MNVSTAVCKTVKGEMYCTLPSLGRLLIRVKVVGEWDTGLWDTTKLLGISFSVRRGGKPNSSQSNFRLSELFLKLDCKLPESSN